MTMEVILHVYDVTNCGGEKTNNIIMQINKIFKDGIGLGGIFHSAIQVYGDQEWSFGFCEQGPGVFSCPSKKNPMYTYRESIKLGEISFSVYKFCEKLGVLKLPGWVNRSAHAGDTAAEIAGNTAYRFRQAKTEIVTASKVAYRFLTGVASNNLNTTTNSSSPRGDSNGSSPGCQAGWPKNFISPGAKPSSSSELKNLDQA
ncbi:hypothetical protein CASFOL_023619 [Castilleja foliolosa]|uniref:PPPDE domain-containing protein n=1 Tax=Castilleja foliolosa TaxID=1961234 RepID=A0ABD3CL34_9LAMI